jgi:exopolyphosphatase/guanosine-5'-triphosphate,3'-diphosphate pyrophosphatase
VLSSAFIDPEMKRRVAILDLGTNTFHLLIAETTPVTILRRERIAVKIGAGGINNNLITQEATARAVAAIGTFNRIIGEANVDEVCAIGTSALRNAKNGNEVVAQIKRETGISVRVISGDEEALLIYYGVRSAVTLAPIPSLIVDIGGGSVEFIIGNQREVFWRQSFEIGAQRLLERFQKHDPILPAELNETKSFLARQLVPLATALQRFNPGDFVGSSGTFDTLSEIYHLRNEIPYAPDLPETRLTVESFRETFAELVVKNRSERLRIDGMIEMRVDMIVVACCLIEYLLGLHSFTGIRVSTYSLKEGVLATFR